MLAFVGCTRHHVPSPGTLGTCNACDNDRYLHGVSTYGVWTRVNGDDVYETCIRARVPRVRLAACLCLVRASIKRRYSDARKRS